jgi:hypothetical protein
MDVIDFLCVSLGSSIVQLHESLGSRRACARSEIGFSNQNGDRALGVYYPKAGFCCAFFFGGGQKDSVQRIFIKTCFLFMVGSVCRVSGSQLGRETWQIFRWSRSRWDSSQKLLYCEFRRTGKVIGHVSQCWWRICRAKNGFFPGPNITCFTFDIHLWPLYWFSIVPRDLVSPHSKNSNM